MSIWNFLINIFMFFLIFFFIKQNRKEIYKFLKKISPNKYESLVSKKDLKKEVVVLSKCITVFFFLIFSVWKVHFVIFKIVNDALISDLSSFEIVIVVVFNIVKLIIYIIFTLIIYLIICSIIFEMKITKAFILNKILSAWISLVAWIKVFAIMMKKKIIKIKVLVQVQMTEIGLYFKRYICCAFKWIGEFFKYIYNFFKKKK